MPLRLALLALLFALSACVKMNTDYCAGPDASRDPDCLAATAAERDAGRD